MSNRANMLQAFRTRAESVRQGSYIVKRGVVDYAAFDWATYKRSWAIHVDEGSLFNSSEIGASEASLTFEIYSSMSPQEHPLVDDGLHDELIEDCVTVIEEALLVANSDGDPVILGVDRTSGRFIESHDVQLRVQGIVATFSVTY